MTSVFLVRFQRADFAADFVIQGPAYALTRSDGWTVEGDHP